MEIDQKNTCPVPNGTLLIIGGHENKGETSDKEEPTDYRPEEILKTFIELIQKDNPLIEVITTASAEGDESFKEYKKVFASLGAKHVNHIHHEKRGEVLNTEIVERVRKADAVFFAGGDQLKLTSIYGGTHFIFELKRRYIYEKLIVAGTSAGAMALSTPMIFAGNKDKQQIAGEIRITTGLEFLKDVCIDTHFVDRGRFVRISQVIATNPTCIGLGIEEDTAVIVRNGVEAEIIGNGVAIVVEGFGITDSNILNYGTNERIHIDNINVKLLAHGSVYSIPRNNPPHI